MSCRRSLRSDPLLLLPTNLPTISYHPKGCVGLSLYSYYLAQEDRDLPSIRGLFILWIVIYFRHPSISYTAPKKNLSCLVSRTLLLPSLIQTVCAVQPLSFPITQQQSINNNIMSSSSPYLEDTESSVTLDSYLDPPPSVAAPSPRPLTNTSTTSTTTTTRTTTNEDDQASFVDSLSDLGFANALDTKSSEEEEEEEEKKRPLGAAAAAVPLIGSGSAPTATKEEEKEPEPNDDQNSVDSMEERHEQVVEHKKKTRSQHLWGVLAPTTMALGTMLTKLTQDAQVVDEDDVIAAAGIIKESATVATATTTTTQGAGAGAMASSSTQ